MKYLTSKNVCYVFGVTFLVAGLLGFVPNPLVSPTGLFEVNFMHNVVHIATAAVFLFGGARIESFAKRTLQAVGIGYVVVAILGFFVDGNMLLGIVHINEADKWLHAGLAAVIVAAGFGLPDPQSRTPASA